MDARPKSSTRSGSVRDNFLVDAVRPQARHLSIGDGFRFGIGFFTAHLLIALVIAGLAWALIVAFKLHV